MSSRRILVTGANGLLGRVLVPFLAQSGFDVVATARRPQDETMAEVRLADLAEIDAVRALFKGGPYFGVVHAAARVRSQDVDYRAFTRDNVASTKNLVSACAGEERLIFCSTISVYSGDGPYSENAPTQPADVYGRTKLEAERVCLASGHAASLRFGGLHGAPRSDGLVHTIFARSRTGQPIELSEPRTVVTLTFLDDAVRSIAALLDCAAFPAGRAYNVATAEALSHLQLAESIRALLQTSNAIVTPSESKERNRALNTGLILGDLDFSPWPLAEHLRRFAAWESNASAAA
jgi:nucleoside-diphosphate-sugar epimerase